MWYRENNSSMCSSYSEGNASDLLENIDEMFPLCRYYTYIVDYEQMTEICHQNLSSLKG